MNKHRVKGRMEGNSLVVEIPPEIHSPLAASWAVYGGGIISPHFVVNHTIGRTEWVDDPHEYARGVVESLKLPLDETTVLLTTVPQSLGAYREQSYGDEFAIQVFATAGLGNALAAGDEAEHITHYAAGTINVIVAVSGTLTLEALLQSISIVTEAKTLCLVDRGVESVKSGRQATGTGTDCVAIISLQGETVISYAGKHSKFGQLLAQVTMAALGETLDKRGTVESLRSRYCVLCGKKFPT